jgi:cell wall assembly regulator SMI1
MANGLNCYIILKAKEINIFVATINDVITELLTFSTKVLDLNDGVSEDKINAFEKKHGLVLPNDYKILIRKTNGLDLLGTTVYGIYDDSVFMSLDGAFNVEHFEVDNEMPVNLIPFSPDGRGNHYCFDSRKCDNESCKIVFWQHDAQYDEVMIGLWKNMIEMVTKTTLC